MVLLSQINGRQNFAVELLYTRVAFYSNNWKETTIRCSRNYRLYMN